MIPHNYVMIEPIEYTGSIFRVSGLAYFWTSGRIFLLRPLNQFLVIRIQISYTYVYVFKYSIYCFVCCLKFYKSIFFFTPLKSITVHIELYEDANANDGRLNIQNDDYVRSKWSNFKYTMIVLL